MIFLRTINVKITQSHHLAFGFWQNEPDIIIKGKFGKTINIQRVLRFTFLYESFFSIAVNCGAGSIKKINFVYISVDKDYQAWKNAIQKFDIDGYHFISPPNKLDNAGEFFNVSGIPRYIIIDKNGNILDDNAKRPSDEDIIDYLIDFIN